MAAELPDEPLLHEQVAFAHEDGFIDYLARRLCIETNEARARLSAWMTTCEPPRRSGVQRQPSEQPELEQQRSA